VTVVACDAAIGMAVARISISAAAYQRNNSSKQQQRGSNGSGSSNGMPGKISK